MAISKHIISIFLVVGLVLSTGLTAEARAMFSKVLAPLAMA